MILNGVCKFQSGATNDPVPAGQNLPASFWCRFSMESASFHTHTCNIPRFSWYRRQFRCPPDVGPANSFAISSSPTERALAALCKWQSVGIHMRFYDPFSYDITTTSLSYQQRPQSFAGACKYNPVEQAGGSRGNRRSIRRDLCSLPPLAFGRPCGSRAVPATSSTGAAPGAGLDNNRVARERQINGATMAKVNGFAFSGTNLWQIDKRYFPAISVS